MVTLIAVVGAVVFISALCSLFEAVLYSVPISHVEGLAQAGHASGRILRRLRSNVDRPISAILSLNTVANTGGGAISGAVAVNAFGENPMIIDIYFPAFFTLCILLLSEVIPKTAGVIYSRPISGYIARPLQVLVWVFTPLIELLQFVTRMVSRGNTAQAISEEELIVLARLGQRIGAIEEDEAQVIQNILSLKSKTARDVMTPRTVVFSLSDTLTVEEARKEAPIWSYSRIPVYAEDFEDIVGVVLRRDMLAALAADRGHVKLSELMRPVHFVVESASLDRLLRMFLERRQHLFVVIDEYGGLAGVLTLEDVLETILGKEIVDESDQVADMRELAHRRRQQTLSEQSGGKTS